MIEYSTKSGSDAILHIQGDVHLLVAESTFLIKEIWCALKKESPLAADVFKMHVMSTMPMCFMTDEQRKDEVRKNVQIIELLKDALNKMGNEDDEDKKPDVSADFMSDEEFRKFFDKFRGEDN